ncbi:MAG: glycosyltransferase family 2 protein [Ruthenibacterium sp.]
MRLKLQWKRIKELLRYGVTALREDGACATCKRAAGFFKRRFGGKKGRFLPPKSVLAAQKEKDTLAWPVFSICVPLYNTPPAYLHALLDSVVGQTCKNWQLCLANASDAQHAEVGEIVKKYAAADARIVCKKVKNVGISANTNAAARLATGDYIALADHDDVLAPHAVFMMAETAFRTGAGFLYSDEALFTKDIRHPLVGHFKPNFAPDYLNCCNYICHFSACKRELFVQLDGLDPAFDGSQDHDLFLRLSELVPPEHIPRVLYYWRVHAASTSGGVAAKPYVADAAKRAIAAHLARIGANGTVTDGLFLSTYKVEYEISGEPLVSILIPNMDHTEDLDKALQSIFTKTTYSNYEIMIIENNSTKPETFAYYDALTQAHRNVRIVSYVGGFNFSAINNFGREHAKGRYLLLLNNDVEIINGTWLTEMLSLCVQTGVGAVGAKLYYPDDTLQHAGVVTGLGGYAGHSHKYAKRGGSGYMFRASTVQDVSAVTAACMLVKASVYDEVDGLDEAFTVAFNDVDFCLRIGRAGYRILFTPYAELYHYESKSRGLDEKNAEKRARFDGERARMKELYGDVLTHDPFYNINLTLDREDFSESSALPRYDA